MIKNYLRVAFRSLIRRKVFAAINIIGLSMGITIVLLIFLFLQYDLTYEKNHANIDNIYRVVNHYNINESDSGYSPYLTAKLATEIEPIVPGIEKIARVTSSSSLVKTGDTVFEEDFTYVDPATFDIFTFDFTEGSADDLANDQKAVVVSTVFAEKFFNRTNIVNEEIELQTEGEFHPYRICGVYEPFETNSMLESDIYLHFQIFYDEMLATFVDSWGFSFSSTFFMLEEGVSAEEVVTAMNDHLESIEVVQDESGQVNVRFELQNFADTHIDLFNTTVYPTEIENTPFWILSGIGFIILLIAIINFTTLSIGSATYRAAEVGVRKVLGSDRKQITNQFWVETGLITLISVLVGFTIAELILPSFNILADRTLELGFQPSVIAFLTILWIILTMLAGSYPGLVISKFNPIEAMKGNLRIGGKKRLRKSLVLIQFSLSIFLISSTLIMKHQLSFIQSRDLGYNKEQVVVLSMTNQDYTAMEAVATLRNTFSTVPEILQVGGSSNNFKKKWSTFNWNGPNGEEFRDIAENNVDYNFLNTLDLELLQGDGFIDKSPREGVRQIVINESMREILGFENAIGKRLPGEQAEHEIVGVIKDFHFESMRTEIRPLILTMDPWLMFPGNCGCSTVNWYTIQHILVRISPENIPATMKTIEKTWREFYPDFVYSYEFLDEEVGLQYAEDKKWENIIFTSSIIAIIIAILGLLGLSTLEVAQRTKEIGIRKVLGASASGIILMLSKEISRLIIIASVVAWGTAWLVMNKWLENFAYRVSISPLILFLAGLAAFLIAILTVTALSFRVANDNPVNSLRDE